MNKLIVYFFAATVFIFSSCGGGSESEKSEASKVDTKDVNGTIESGDAEIGTTTLHNNDGEFDVPKIKLNDNSFMIVPTTRMFEDEWKVIESNLTAFGTFEIIEKKENAVFYKVMKDFAGKKEEGYSFLVWVKGKDKNYMMVGESDFPLQPIIDKEAAKSIFEIALSFKPE